MPYADLHVHTTRSDGTLEFAEIPAAARDADVSVVGLTDHDRLQEFSEPVIKRDGVVLVSGIELRVAADGMRVDLLGYALTATTALEECLGTIQRNRRERARTIVEKVEKRCGVTLDLEVHDGIGRPHIARAIEDHTDVPYDYQGAFDELIGSDGPCYVPREIPDFETGLALLEEAASVVSVAHPLRYDDRELTLELAAEVGGIEVHYPYDRPVDLEPIERAVEKGDLTVTGGSDAHEETLGEAGLSRSAYEALPFPRPCR